MHACTYSMCTKQTSTDNAVMFTPTTVVTPTVSRGTTTQQLYQVTLMYVHVTPYTKWTTRFQDSTVTKQRRENSHKAHYIL